MFFNKKRNDTKTNAKKAPKTTPPTPAINAIGVASKPNTNPVNINSNISPFPISKPDSRTTTVHSIGSKKPEPKFEPVTFLNVYKMLVDTLDTYIKNDFTIVIATQKITGHLALWKRFVPRKHEPGNYAIIKKLPNNESTVKSLKLIYGWMTCKVTEIHKNDFFAFCRTIDKLDIEDLQYQCWNFIDYCKKHYVYESPMRCVLKPPSLGLRDIVLDILGHNMGVCFLYLVATDDFLNLTLEEVVLLLGSPEVAVNTEVEIFLAAVRWLTIAWTQRKKFVVPVVECVRFGVAPLTLQSLIRKKDSDVELVATHPKVKLMIRNAENRERRKWFVDKRCSYHRCNQCNKKDMQLGYTDFLDYLEVLLNKGPDFSNSKQLSQNARLWNCCKCTR